MANESFNKLTILTLLSLIQYIMTQTNCGGLVAESTGRCTMYSTNVTLCCFLRTFSNNFWSSMCHSINATDYLALNGQIQLGGYVYSVDCGDSIGTTCGTIMSPLSYKVCGQYSLNSYSCCYFMFQGDTSCVWLGTGHTGEINYKGIQLICIGEFVKTISLFYMIAFLFFIFY